MKISALIQLIDVIPANQRAEYLRPLLSKLCPLSRGDLDEFQRTWDGSRSYEDFCIEQNKVIARCVKLETSPIGAFARKGFHLEPLTLDDEILINEVV